MTQIQQTNKCLLCKKENVGFYRSQDGASIYYYDCPVCGNYGITSSARAVQRLNSDDIYILSGVIKNASKKGKQIVLSFDNIESFIKNAQLPADLFQYIDCLLLFIAERSDIEGLVSKINKANDYSNVYARSVRHLESLLQKAVEMHYIASDANHITIRLTTEGWKRVLELKKLNNENPRLVFMAMQFSNPLHNKIYQDNFVPAVAQTGFDLKKVSEMSQAGIIDNLIRVKIHQCRFLLADLTDENRGAYWEAGFAEGLGKPVIYLCRKNDEGTLKTHFDTNHHTTIIWDENDLPKAVVELKATIRATFPNEAIMTDKE